METFMNSNNKTSNKYASCWVRPQTTHAKDLILNTEKYIFTRI